MYASNRMPAPLIELNNKRLPLNRAIISDIALWVLLAALLAFGVYMLAVRIPEKRGQTITLHFKDANEVSKGSMVRMMGVDIGYVDDVRIRQDHVDVTLQTYPEALQIPSGAMFTVLFTGLAGSKSIEIELPDTPRPALQGRPIYVVEEPIRMKDMLNANLDVTQALQGGAENIADFFGKKKPVEELQFNIREAHELSLVYLTEISNFKEDLRWLEKDIAVNALAAIDTIGDINRGAEVAVIKTEPVRVRNQITAFLKTMRSSQRLFVTEAKATGATVSLYSQVAKINDANSKLSHWMSRAENSIANFPIQQYAENFENGTIGFSDFVNRLDAFVGDDPLPSLKHARQTIRNFNRQVLSWSAKVDQKKGAQPRQGSKDSTGQQSQPDVSASGSVDPDGPTADDEQLARPLVIADEDGNTVEQITTPWWNQKNTKPTVATDASQPAATQQKKPFFLVRFFHAVCDAIRALFQ